MNNMKIEYGKYIKENRMKLNLSEADLASMLRVTPSAISRWENDVSEIKLKYIVSLSYIFGVSVNDFINRIYGKNFELDKKYGISKYKGFILNSETKDFDYNDFANEYLIAYKKLEKQLEEFYKNPTLVNKEIDYLLNVLAITFSYDEILDEDYDSEGLDLFASFIKLKDQNVKYISNFELKPNCLLIGQLIDKEKNNKIFNLQLKLGINIEDLLTKITDDNIKFKYIMNFNLSEKILDYAISKKDYDLAIAFIVKHVKIPALSNIDNIKKTLIKYIINNKYENKNGEKNK